MQLTQEVVALGEATDALLVEARRGGMASALVASLRSELRSLHGPVIAFYKRLDAAMMDSQTTTKPVPVCPWCGTAKKVYVHGHAQFWCRACKRAFDRGEGLDETIGYGSPFRRLDREEWRASKRSDNRGRQQSSSGMK